MREPCGNTQAEIDNDSPLSFQQVCESRREHERAMHMLREKRAEFIAKLLRNEDATVKMFSGGKSWNNTYTLAEAIEDIDEEAFWETEVAPGLTMSGWFADFPDNVCISIAANAFPQLNIYVRHAVEKLSDYVRF